MLKRLLILLGLAALLGAGYAMAAGMTVAYDGRRPAARAGDRGLGRHGHVRQLRRQGAPDHDPARQPREPGDQPRRHVRRTCSTAAAATTATARRAAARTSSATIVVELKGSVTLKPSATDRAWGKPLRLTGKSTFPGTPVNIVERCRAAGDVLDAGRHRRGGGRRLVRGRAEAAARRPVSRAGCRRPDLVRHGANLGPADRSRFARSRGARRSAVR